MLKKRFFLPLLLSLFSFGLVVACNSSTPTSQNSPSPAESPTNSTAIPIGAALAQTSNVALLGQEQVVGVKIAEKYFNDKGGVNGTPIRVVLQDTAGDEQGAINAINTLITQDKVVGIVGPSLSQQAFAASPIADRAKVPILGPSNTAKGIPQIGDYVGRVSAPVAIVAPNSIKAALKIDPKIKKVAVFFAQNDAFSKSETETFQQTLKDLKLDIVTVQKFQTTDTDFQNQATAAINAKPDLIVISGLVADGGNLVKQLRQLGYKGLIIGGNGLNTSNLFPVCQAQCDGILVAQAYSPELDNPINKEFIAAYEAEKKKLPPQFTAQAFTGIQVFVEALKRVDDKNKISTLSLEQLRQQLNQEILTGKYNTVLGEISFTPEGEIVQNKFYVARIKMDADGKNGKFTFIQ
ncbi:ABC transporter substrate-binding protein [Pannus brasiliensis CCIBt3594]|uniref:ABC transporter substrate-binding protein n=1 Tax=Pannus brasiliensis CCIBt3594 TaxID=1427578 RepID=A0AAW9QSH8_9CHRO